MPESDLVPLVRTPLSALWAADAEREEVQALVQFAFLRRPLTELLQAAAREGLDLIVLKGAALAETVYPRPSLRRFGDIDLLVRTGDAARANTLLLGLSYAVDKAAWADLAQGRECEANFFRETDRGPVVLELHTNLLNNVLLRSQVSVDQDGLWRRSRPACLAGQDARVLGPEDQLLHLCLHLAGHYFDAPNSLRDIAQVCADQSIDWPLVIALCRSSSASTLCYCGFYAAAALLGASVPPSVLEALAPHPTRRRLLNKLVTSRVLHSAAPQNDVQRFRLLWLALDRPAARVGILRHLLFPTRRWLHAHYYYDLFDPPERALPPRFAFPGLRRLPLGLLLIGAHGGFLLRQCLRAAARSIGILLKSRGD